MASRDSSYFSPFCEGTSRASACPAHGQAKCKKLDNNGWRPVVAGQLHRVAKAVEHMTVQVATRKLLTNIVMAVPAMSTVVDKLRTNNIGATTKDVMTDIARNLKSMMKWGKGNGVQMQGVPVPKGESSKSAPAVCIVALGGDHMQSFQTNAVADEVLGCGAARTICLAGSQTALEKSRSRVVLAASIEALAARLTKECTNAIPAYGFGRQGDVFRDVGGLLVAWAEIVSALEACDKNYCLKKHVLISTEIASYLAPVGVTSHHTWHLRLKSNTYKI